MSRNLRRFGALSAAAVAALTLAGCSPPNEQPSDKKVDTATEAPNGQSTGSATETSSAGQTDTAAAAVPEYADCQSAPEVKPATVTLDCVGGSERLTDVKWQSWTQEQATGTALRDGEQVAVVLSDAADTGSGAPVFTALSVDGEPVNP